MKSQNLLVALSLMVMVAACGKSMSLQVKGAAGDAQNQEASSIDVSKVAQANTCKIADGNTPVVVTGTEGSKKLDSNECLQSFSEFDMKDLKDKIASSSLLRRSTLQIAPKEAVNQVLNLSLTLTKAHIMDATAASICIVETECRSLQSFIIAAVTKNGKEAPIVLDLREVFELTKKTDAEVMDWVYANSTVFAEPGYRKFRFTFEGVESLESGDLSLQVITNEKLKSDFATKPTCYEHGDEDLREPETDTNTNTNTNTVTETNTSTTV